jgi:hypothetical protein
VLLDWLGELQRERLRIVAHVRTTTRRWIAAAIGGYHDGENSLSDGLASSSTPGSCAAITALFNVL